MTALATVAPLDAETSPGGPGQVRVVGNAKTIVHTTNNGTTAAHSSHKNWSNVSIAIQYNALVFQYQNPQ